MSRPGKGPRIVTIQKDGWTKPVYYIRWTENGRTREESTGANPPDLAGAEAYFTDWLIQRGRASSTGPRDPDKVLIREVLEAYALEHGAEVASPETLGFSVAPVAAFFAEPLTVSDITPKLCKAYWAWRRVHSVVTVDEQSIIRRNHDAPPTAAIIRQQNPDAWSGAAVCGPEDKRRYGAGDWTIIRELSGAMRPALSHAIANKMLAPGVYYVPVPPEPPGRDHWITRPQAARLLMEARRERQNRAARCLFILLALYTGQRRSAILELTWPQIDLVRGRINFNPPGRRQTKKRRPIIPIPRGLLSYLRMRQRKADPQQPGLFAVQAIRRGFETAARRAGIEDCTPNTLRHTCGTWMAHRGVPLWEIGGYLGHSEARTTELYAHHHPDFMETARRAHE